MSAVWLAYWFPEGNNTVNVFHRMTDGLHSSVGKALPCSVPGAIGFGCCSVPHVFLSRRMQCGLTTRPCGTSRALHAPEPTESPIVRSDRQASRRRVSVYAASLAAWHEALHAKRLASRPGLHLGSGRSKERLGVSREGSSPRRPFPSECRLRL